MVRPERFELPTPWFVAKYSIQMSYGRLRGRDYTQERDEHKSQTAGSGLAPEMSQSLFLLAFLNPPGQFAHLLGG